jgi:hypothetical protein
MNLGNELYDERCHRKKHLTNMNTMRAMILLVKDVPSNALYDKDNLLGKGRNDEENHP